MSTTIGFKQFGEDTWFVYSNGEVVSRDADGAHPFWSGWNTGHPAVIIADLFRIGYDVPVIRWVADMLAEVDSINSWNDALAIADANTEPLSADRPNSVMAGLLKGGAR